MRFYKDHYDVVIIGGALAGMAAALQLQAKGVRDILILEKHNMPGGVATDYMRDGFEMEASLHEMMSIGPKGKRLKVGQFFDDMGIDIDWLPVPEPYLNRRASRTHRSMMPPSLTRSSRMPWMKQACGCGCS